MQKRRSTALLLAALILVPLIAMLPAPTAQAGPSWPQDIADVQGNELLTHVDGSVTAVSCPSWSSTVALKTFEKTGTVSGSVPIPYTDAFMCVNTKAVGSTGTVFGLNVTNYPIQEVVAYQSGTRLWGRNLTSTCSWNNQTLNLIPERMVVGTDGGLYIVSKEADWSCGNRLYLTKLNAADGTVAFQQLLGDRSIYWLSAYNNGVLLYEHSSTLRYFEHDGDELPPVAVQEGYGSPLAATMDGRLFINIITWPDSSHPCYNGNPYTVKFVGYGPSGKVLDYQPTNCLNVHTAGATPQNGVVLEGRNGQGEQRLVSLAEGGAVNQDVVLPMTDGARTFDTFVYVVTDTNGNTLLIRRYKRDSNQRYKAWQFMLYESSTLAQRAVAAIDKVDDEVDLSHGVWSIAPGRMYVTLTHCSMYGCSDSHPRYLYAIDFAELGMDYPRGAALGVQAANPTKKYVALGDSYSSGEGVEPFDPATERDAPGENRCHRSVGAYANLLDQDASVPLQLTNFVACSGAVTDNVHTSNQWTQQKQVLALSQETDIVTITIGGNDIKFKDFATACIMPNDNCSTVAYANAMEKIEDELPGKLDATYSAIAAQIPSNARVLVIGYPRIIPYDDGTLPTCGVLSG